ncbi:MAG TPA: VOC family protein [Microbacterium sp.]|uniref:VOC family protein n=1 Tax=Microbacterium sp. TaxID=51671 RepID=UPI002B9C65B4|nr:VOC family protein [Microbacterium sp.]HWI32288.1 VOC family protein [Microbacterium sp.]
MPRFEHPIKDTPASLQWKGPLAGTDHTVIRVPDLDVGVAWYRRLLGLVEVERSAGRAFLASPVTGRIVLGLSEGGTGLDYVSFRARNAEAFEAIATKLDEAKTRTALGVATTRPGALDALRVTVPTGHAFEVIHPDADAPAGPVEGEYRPGALDVRTSHLQLRTTDVKAMTDFLGLLGFRSSTFVTLPGTEGYFIQFLRVNEYHHQVAILTGQHGVHHVALEVDEVDFWQLLDNLVVTKMAAEYGPIRHHEGNMLSMYLRDPFKNRIEITSSMEMVGFDYPPTPAGHEPWYHMNMWGPQPPHTWETEWMES